LLEVAAGVVGTVVVVLGLGVIEHLPYQLALGLTIRLLWEVEEVASHIVLEQTDLLLFLARLLQPAVVAAELIAMSQEETEVLAEAEGPTTVLVAQAGAQQQGVLGTRLLLRQAKAMLVV